MSHIGARSQATLFGKITLHSCSQRSPNMAILGSNPMPRIQTQKRSNYDAPMYVTIWWWRALSDTPTRTERPSYSSAGNLYSVLSPALHQLRSRYARSHRDGDCSACPIKHLETSTILIITGSKEKKQKRYILLRLLKIIYEHMQGIKHAWKSWKMSSKF
jgi:hypothetical protein